MRKLIIFALLVFAGWYGWNHYRGLLDKRPSHEAVIQNDTGAALERVRLTVDGQTFVKEEIAENASATIPFRVANDASFALVWQNINRMGEQNWKGGMVPRGPMVQRHVFVIDAD